ncbi:hypothetical protein BJ170DRAFT_597966 [Xylariales sp. AK1849]|nr:hypothetical protein BJ170DRAFT_597966 [Xylariales sp. AK1849]
MAGEHWDTHQEEEMNVDDDTRYYPAEDAADTHDDGFGVFDAGGNFCHYPQPAHDYPSTDQTHPCDQFESTSWPSNMHMYFPLNTNQGASGVGVTHSARMTSEPLPTGCPPPALQFGTAMASQARRHQGSGDSYSSTAAWQGSAKGHSDWGPARNVRQSSEEAQAALDRHDLSPPLGSEDAARKRLTLPEHVAKHASKISSKASSSTKSKKKGKSQARSDDAEVLHGGHRSRETVSKQRSKKPSHGDESKNCNFFEAIKTELPNTR